ncbi:hypothetical protein N7474_008986 [Penicillium riverlandense]|uniref:uncharacterized protein n=1 Tax=Penicillium riverlandense TaxID=1903569 RepID=UPI00254873D0|nr:uncharacterized protein N7474_008986 [Penicillium riverlandense]KAJ5812685.1 hypothetical protein N7474_008986 [Penicillium riverlandense]
MPKRSSSVIPRFADHNEPDQKNLRVYSSAYSVESDTLLPLGIFDPNRISKRNTQRVPASANAADIVRILNVACRYIVFKSSSPRLRLVASNAEIDPILHKPNPGLTNW